jgi:hypothetical protein
VHFDATLEVRVAQFAAGREFQFRSGRTTVQLSALAHGVHFDSAFEMTVPGLVVFIEEQ